ncbi:MAG: HD-GYP domain-containing protein [Firmicutes bacterium]|nr:HD-GYP domain-containing protein [Bacillota bacterium]
MVLSFTNMLEIHDKYTENHSREVANKAKRLAKFLGLNEKDIRDAYWAGIVHDIGKILIPSYILNKKGKLTDDEFFLIKKHPLWGYETLKNSDKLKDISEYVLYHHERWDGFGYPLGLKGDNIPLISQILAVADTWDAMRSNRSYRKALPKKEAIKEIRKNKGTQFSPRVVDVFLENIEKFK